MPKRSSTLPLALPSRPRHTPAGRWLRESLRDRILLGALPPGARLPATRDLARQYGVSRGTVVVAYAQLASEGYLAGAVGSGTFVSSTLPEELLSAGPPRLNASASARPVRPPRRSRAASRIQSFRAYDPTPARAFRTNAPAVDEFPAGLWAQVAARRLRRVSVRMLMGCEAVGYPPLRAAIADYLRSSRGVRCDEAQVVIVSGIQEALDLVVRLTLDPGDRACMEDPGYTGAVRVFEAHGVSIAPVPVDDEGIVLGGAPWSDARLAYVTPAHQYPLGVAMSLPRRLALLDWARRSGGWIFEDDYDSEFRYAGRPLPALQGLDANEVVCFAGSLGKVLFPSLRLGYLVVPPSLVEPVAALKSVTTRHAPLLDQAVVCDFVTEGHFARHIRRMRGLYAERSAAMLSAMRAELSGVLDLSPIEAGLQTVGWLARGFSGDEAERAAGRHGVEVGSLSALWRAASRREGLRLGFAAIGPRAIRAGVRALAAALAEIAPHGRGRRRV